MNHAIISGAEQSWKSKEVLLKTAEQQTYVNVDIKV